MMFKKGQLVRLKRDLRADSFVHDGNRWFKSLIPTARRSHALYFLKRGLSSNLSFELEPDFLYGMKAIFMGVFEERNECDLLLLLLGGQVYVCDEKYVSS